MARVAPGAPSLIQVLEQKGFLSTTERLGLLSAAEDAGLGIETVEQLGLLKLVEDLGLLTTAETLVTSPSTPTLLLGAATVLSGLVFLDVAAPDFGFLQWVIAGGLGAPALALLGTAIVINLIAGGARRSRDIELDDKVVTFNTSSGFTTANTRESFTLLDVLEKKNILSFLEENRLLSLAASLVKRPLTLTQNLGVLSTLEKLGVLSQVESSATDTFAAARFGLLGLVLIVAALVAPLAVPDFGFLLAVLLALPGLALIAVGVAFGIIQAPSQRAMTRGGR